MATTLSPVSRASSEYSEGVPVLIGEYTYQVVPQRIGRLRKRLGRALGDLETLQGDSITSFAAESMDRTHTILKVFIPDLMPIWEFSGYRSEAAMEADEEEEGEYGPTLPDIVHAFEVVMKVNRLDLLGHLRQVISPELIRAYIATKVGDAIAASPTSSSASSASTNGLASGSTITGPRSPTSEPSVA